MDTNTPPINPQGNINENQIAPNPQDQKPISPNSTNRMRLFLILIFIALILSSTVLFLFIKTPSPLKNQVRNSIYKPQTASPSVQVLSPTPNPFSNWLTYKATEYMGGEVGYRYPSSFKPWQETEGMGGERRQVYTDRNLTFEFDRDLECTFNPTPIQLPINSIHDCLKEQSSSQPLINMTIGGQEAVEFSNTLTAADVGKGHEETQYTVLLLSKDKKSIYVFNITINSTDPQQIESGNSLFQQILTTVSL